MNNFKLGELIEITSSKRIHAEDYVESGIPFYRSKEIIQLSRGENITEILYISVEQYSKIKLRFPIPKNGDILLTSVGTIGIPYYVRDENFYFKDGNLTWFRNFSEKINSKYLLFWMQSNFFKSQINNNNIGAVQKALTIDFLKKFNIQLPNLKIQSEITYILTSIVNKIELNNKINAELEAMAKTLYDYWFVQFDFPDTNGKPYKSSGGKMVWNEELKREIPVGWEVGTLLDIADFVNGLACQKFRPNENEDSYRVIKIREMGTGFTENSEFVSTNIPDKVIIHNGDILFSWSATLDVKIWTGGTGALNQHIFKITSNDFPKSYYYFELLNYLQHFKMQAELRKTTMGHITQDHLKQSRITIPSFDLINKLDKIIKPILDKKVKLEEENQELISLRDWLLPMLMNGQVSVGGFEEELEYKKV